MKRDIVGPIVCVLFSSGVASAGGLTLPSGLRVALDDADAGAWTAAANADGDVLTMTGAGERLELEVAPIDGDRTCAAMLDGPATSDLAWGRQVARDLGLPPVLHETVRIDRSHPGAVQRIACAQTATTTLTASWVADESETDASRASAARVLGAIATAFTAAQAREAHAADAVAAAPIDDDGTPLALPDVPRAPAPGGRHHRDLAQPAEQPPAPPTDELGRPLLPGAALLVPRLEVGLAHLAPAIGGMAGAASAIAIADRPIIPISNNTDFGYEWGGMAGVSEAGAAQLAAHTGVGYHVLKGGIGVYAIGGVGVDYLGSGPMSFGLGAAPDAYAGAVTRTFPTPNVLLEMRATRVFRRGTENETEGALRIAWTPAGHRAFLVDAFVRDYDHAASMLGTAVGFGF
jgi:hypothetical protein